MASEEQILLSPVKVNLNLKIVGTREDGFHDISTTFLSLKYGDRISFKQTEVEDKLICSNSDLPTDRQNLVLNALYYLRKSRNDIPPLEINLYKEIPPGSGLGAGSSNAAITLLYANSLSSRPVGFNELSSIGSKIGSDVPFFLKGGLAEAEGRGEKINFSGKMIKKYFLLLIPKDIIINTKWAYQSFDLTDKYERDRKEIFYYEEKIFFNDFEIVVFNKYNILKKYRKKLLHNGADVALLSGSGAAVFGLFTHLEEAERAKLNFKEDDVTVVLTTPINTWDCWQNLRL